MTNLNVCRTCLSFSTRMHELRNTQLQEIFEKFTSKKPNKEDRTTICYICYAQLQKCRRFSEMSLKTEVILTELVSKGIEITNEAISRLTKRKSSYLVTPVDYFYNGSRNETIEIVAKENTTFTQNEVDVKVEKVEIEESFTEVAYEERLVMKEEPSIIEEQIIIKEEVSEEMGHEEYIDIEGEIALNENCESESEDLLQCDEYVDIEGVIINGKDNLLPRNNSRTNITCNDQVLRFNCNMCSKILSSETKLKNHIKTHTEQDLYTCDICNKTFNMKCNIIQHMSIHSGLKPYTCLLCDKAFRLRRYLREHIKIHTGEKPYSCDKCIKRFTDKSSFNRHMISHNSDTGEKKHICNQCHRKFTRKCYLKTHMRIHTGQKPFTCNVCNKSFAQQSAWKGHMRIHTGEKTHYCDKCNKGFYRKGHLHQHMIVHTRLRL